MAKINQSMKSINNENEMANNGSNMAMAKENGVIIS
jgi:hypothetical protein